MYMSGGHICCLSEQSHSLRLPGCRGPLHTTRVPNCCAGLFVMSPSRADFRRFDALLASGAIRCGGYAEQDLLNEYFKVGGWMGGWVRHVLGV